MFTRLLRPLRLHFGKDKEYYRAMDRIFGLYPNNIELYKLALIHRSASLFLPGGLPINNERLEFLGDAILESIVSDYLFIEFPDRGEGFLTQLRSKLVSRHTLNQLAMDLGLDRYIISQTGINYTQKHLLGDAFEAMVGAIYLDKGYDYINRLIINRIFPQHIDLTTLTEAETDYKSRLIEWCQKNKRDIHFETVPSEHTTAQNPHFASTVLIDGIKYSSGEGESKKEAEQHASAATAVMLPDEAQSYISDRIET